MVEVTREATFDSAHMLSYYNGKCNNLHGHTYKVRVTIKSTDVCKANGMVVDFNNMKGILDDTVMKNFDHAFIASGKEYREPAETSILEVLKKNCLKFYELQDRKSTSENIALTIKEQVENQLNNQYMVKVDLWETPNSFTSVWSGGYYDNI